MLHLPTVQGNLADYKDAGFPILYICTDEEDRADRYIESIVGRAKAYEWNGANGVVDFKTKVSKWSGEETLTGALSTFKMSSELNRALLVIKDADKQLDDHEGNGECEKVTALLKEIARNIRRGKSDATVIIVSSEIHIPKPLEKLVTILELDLPDEKEIKDIINSFIQEQGISEIPGKFLDDMTIAFKGITESEIKDLLGLSVSRDGELTEKALQLILDQKQQLILKAGILEMIPLKESMADIGGLENLKDWLQKKAKVFKNMRAAEEFGVTMPKGVLIAGVPGCGKSLTARQPGSCLMCRCCGWIWVA